MPSVQDQLLHRIFSRGVDGLVHLEDVALDLSKRVKIPINSTTPPSVLAAISQDPWKRSGKYALGWVYFCIILLLLTTAVRIWNYWGDRIRVALYKDEIITSAALSASAMSAGTMWELPSTATDHSRQIFFPPSGPLVTRKQKQQSTASAIAPVNNTIAFFRYVFYRPVPPIRIWKWTFILPSLAVGCIVLAGLAFSLLYCFLPRPLFYPSMADGSPPLAIRAGMMSVALVPWITALSSKANMISFMTGIGAERLIVLHRWAAYLCIILAIIHAVPYWYQSARDPTGFEKFKLYFHQTYYIFTTGIAALVPLLFLFFHSLPVLRNRFYEIFVLLHIPVAWASIGLLFWHCHNYLTSWAYLWTTVVLMVISSIARLFYLNWMNPFRASWLIGEESAVTILPENAIKVTIPTQKRWKPGQYAYLRMPGISPIENHPFTISSLCSEDFPSDYGEQYRDLTMVFRPFAGFTRKVFDTAQAKGPYKTYRSFIEGPYGGMQRQISSFDQVIFFAGGSGITAIASQLLDVVKRMRDGKATTRSVHVIWAMKRPEIMEWFKEELRICREYAPAGSVHCHFFITSARRYNVEMVPNRENRLSQLVAEKVDSMLKDVGSKRDSKRIHDIDSKGEETDLITALPAAHEFASPISRMPYFPPPPGQSDYAKRTAADVKRQSSTLSSAYDDDQKAAVERLYNAQRSAVHSQHHPNVVTNDFAMTQIPQMGIDEKVQTPQQFDFGFGSSPTAYQRSMMQFAIIPEALAPASPLKPAQPPPAITMAPSPNLADLDPDFKDPALLNSPPQQQIPFTNNRTSLYQYTTSPHMSRRNDGWRTEYGRPDVPFMLKNLSSEFSRRTCIYVCGPPEMRRDVARTVADLQRLVWTDPNRDEIFLHAENYSV